MKTPASRSRKPVFPGRVLPGLLAVAALTVIAIAAGRSWGAEAALPTPEPVTLETKDNVLLTCQWYGSPKSEKDGKKVVPVIIVHGWGEQRSQYDGLATYLQKQGHAVIVPDLRGHGGSTTIKRPGEDTDLSLKLQDGKMEFDGKPVREGAVIEYMATHDLPAVKTFLLERNNAGEVNIELLCAAAFKQGCIVAVNWAAYDWNRPRLPTYKLGQDVKALALISPPQSFMGATMTKALAHQVIREKMNVMIVVGNQDTEAYSDAKRVHKSFDRFRPAVAPEDRRKKQDLFLIEAGTPLQGLDMLAAGRFDVEKKIAGFIQLRLVEKADLLPWTDRTLP